MISEGNYLKPQTRRRCSHCISKVTKSTRSHTVPSVWVPRALQAAPPYAGCFSTVRVRFLWGVCWIPTRIAWPRETRTSSPVTTKSTETNDLCWDLYERCWEKSKNLLAMVTSDMNRAAGCELPAESLRRVTVNSGLASASEHLQHDELGNHTPEKARTSTLTGICPIPNGIFILPMLTIHSPTSTSPKSRTPKYPSQFHLVLAEHRIAYVNNAKSSYVCCFHSSFLISIDCWWNHHFGWVTSPFLRGKPPFLSPSPSWMFFRLPRTWDPFRSPLQRHRVTAAKVRPLTEPWTRNPICANHSHHKNYTDI